MFALTEIPPEKSSQVASYGYDSAQRVLRVQFRSSTRAYDYRDVPPEKIEALAAAPSIGKFIAAEIRGKHDYEPVPTEDHEDGPITTKTGATIDTRAAWPFPTAAAPV